MKTIKLFTLLAAVSAVGGCSGSDKVDIGDNSPPANLGSKLTDYTGSWSGYAEAFQFADLSDRVRLVLDEHGEGTLEIGEDGPQPMLDLNIGPPSRSVQGLIPAYSYTLASSTVTEKRIKIAARSSEPDAPYCASFTPVYDTYNGNGYGCLPNLSVYSNDGVTCFFTPSDGPEIPFDCRKDRCRLACTCTETSCTSNSAGDDIQIDAALSDANTLIGTLIVPDGRVTIRLERN